MKVVSEFNYRNAKEILEKKSPYILKEIYDILNDPDNRIDLTGTGSQRRLSAQIQDWFIRKGWRKEQPAFSIGDLRYDLLKNNIPIEIEIGHQRLVYADFFKATRAFERATRARVHNVFGVGNVCARWEFTSVRGEQSR